MPRVPAQRHVRRLSLEQLERRDVLSSLPPFDFLEPGDANEDGYFDPADIIQVLKAGEYLSGRPASWGE